MSELRLPPGSLSEEAAILKNMYEGKNQETNKLVRFFEKLSLKIEGKYVFKLDEDWGYDSNGLKKTTRFSGIIGDTHIMCEFYEGIHANYGHTSVLRLDDFRSDNLYIETSTGSELKYTLTGKTRDSVFEEILRDYLSFD